MVVKNGDDFLAFLMLVAGIADAIAPFVATVLVPSPWSTRRSSCCSAARCHTRAMHARPSDPSSAHVAKPLETVVSWKGWCPIGLVRPGQALPRHPYVAHPEHEVKDA